MGIRDKAKERFQSIFTDVLCRGMLAFNIAMIIAYATHSEITESESKAIFWSAISVPALSLALVINSFFKVKELNFNRSLWPVALLRFVGLISSLVATGHFFFAFSKEIGWAFMFSTAIAFFVSLHIMPAMNKRE